MSVLRKMKIQLAFSSHLLQRKNVFFALFFVFVFCFGVNVSGALAAEITPQPTASVQDAPQSTSVTSATPLTVTDTTGGESKSDIASSIIGDVIAHPFSNYIIPYWKKEVLPAAGSTVGGIVSDGLKSLAQGVLTLEAGLANAAAILFVWILNPASFDMLMNNSAIYEVWKIVRDTCNMIFILVLLFSAFATIYQIDKYKYNKILWMVVIMALLVNFSWPISRVIVDFFNTMMYFFVNSVFHQTPELMAKGFLGGTDMKAIFLPPGSEDEWGPLLMAIVVMFIFMMTLLVLSLMMLIRMVALPILVMFSPIGFAGMAAPLTQSYAKKWWDNLFKYASYGPIAVFMVLVSMLVLQNIQGGNAPIKESIKATAGKMSSNNAAINSDVLASVAFYAIPIVLFWMAITLAEKSSNELSSSATKFGMTAGRWARRKSWGGAKGVANWTGVPGGISQAWKNRQGMFGASSKLAREAREDKLARRIGAGGITGTLGALILDPDALSDHPVSIAARNAKKDAADKRVAAAQERLKRLGNATTADALLNSGNADEKKAAALYLADKKAFKDADAFNKALDAVGDDLASATKILDGAPDVVLQEAGALVDVMAKLKTDKLKGLQGKAIDKFAGKGLGGTEANYAKIAKEFDTTALTVGADDVEIARRKALMKKYNQRLASEGQSKIHFDHVYKNNGGNSQDAYKQTLSMMSADDLVSQDDSMLTSPDAEVYFKSLKRDRLKQLDLSAPRKGASAAAQAKIASALAGSAGTTPTLSFLTSSSTVTIGASVTLTWRSTDATSCTPSGGNGSGAGMRWSPVVSLPASGTRSITITAPGTFTFGLRANGAGGAVSSTETVTVSAV